MKATTESIISAYCEKHSAVKAIEGEVRQAVDVLKKAYFGGGKLLVCGNGGSSADADHIVGELMKAFRIHRPLEKSVRESLLQTPEGARLADVLEGAFPAINLSAHTALITAELNDVGADYIYAQQVIGYGRPGDVLLGISTSGHSRNVLYAGAAARARGMRTIGLTGCGGEMADAFDVLLRVRADSVEEIQDMHIVLYHLLCAALENELWGV